MSSLRGVRRNRDENVSLVVYHGGGKVGRDVYVFLFVGY